MILSSAYYFQKFAADVLPFMVTCSHETDLTLFDCAEPGEVLKTVTSLYLFTKGLDCVWLCWTRWGSEDCDQPVHVHKRGTPATAWRGSALHAAHNVWRGTELVCALLLSLSVDRRKLNIYGSWRICLFAFPVDMGSATFIWLFFLFLVESYVVVDARCELF